jgi:hypothetical protein
MKIITSFGLFLTSEWIWAVTFARAHVLLSMPILLITFLVIGKMRLTSAILYAFFAPIFSLSVFTFLVHGVIDWFFGINFTEMHNAYVVHPFAATFLLAMIYVFFQWLFFTLLSFCYRLPIKRYIFAALIGNLITMSIVYKFLPSL